MGGYILSKSILIIDDDLTLYHKIKEAMQHEFSEIYCTNSLVQSFSILSKHDICIVIMDAFLSEIDGLRFLKYIREYKSVPVLVISSSNNDKVEAYKAGAIGFINKPYCLEECLAHTESIMRLYLELQTKQTSHQTLDFGMKLLIDSEKHRVVLNGKVVKLTRKEFDILLCLVNHAGQILSREQLYQMVWKEDISYNIDELVKAHIKSLRKKLAFGGKEYIKNEWGVRYRFLLDEEQL